VSRSLVERRLAEVSARLRKLRGELHVADEQLLHLAEQADEARLRALVSETPVAERDHRDASRHAEAMQRFRAELQQNIDELETAQDDLLDRLSALLGST
jgi:predicted  nucleic acid-binding Zn-ribbon protein